MAKVISVFNNKGGVGKTTMVWNIGDALARKGKKVLLVDFDPQCNLSIAVLGSEAFTKTLPTQNVPYGKTIRAYLQRFLQGTGGWEFFQHNGEHTHKSASLVAGDFWLNVYAESLNVGSDILTGTGIARYLVLRSLLDAATEGGNTYDYVLIDLPPSFGALVRAAYYSSDYYIVPCTSDTFSAYCVSLIGQMFPTFSDDWDAGMKRFKASNPYFSKYDSLGHPKFAGWIFNGFDIRSDRIVRADAVHKTKIQDAIRDELARKVPIAANVQPEIPLGEVEDMNVLIQNSIWQSSPIAQLPKLSPIRSLTSTGAWAENQREQIKSIGKGFAEIADRVIAVCV